VEQSSPCCQGVRFGKTDSLAAGWGSAVSGPRWICKPERAATSCRHSTDANLGGYKNPGHLIRTQGGRGHAHGIGSPSGGVDSQSAPKRYHAAVRGRGLWFVHSSSISLGL
jgi:hypothetical protein